jgi:hypothetical protein
VVFPLGPPTGAPGGVIVRLIPIIAGVPGAVRLRGSVARSKGGSDGRGRLAEARSRECECPEREAHGESDAGESETVREENTLAHARRLASAGIRNG